MSSVMVICLFGCNLLLWFNFPYLKYVIQLWTLKPWLHQQYASVKQICDFFTSFILYLTIQLAPAAVGATEADLTPAGWRWVPATCLNWQFDSSPSWIWLEPDMSLNEWLSLGWEHVRCPWCWKGWQTEIRVSAHCSSVIYKGIRVRVSKKRNFNLAVCQSSRCPQTQIKNLTQI